MRDRNGIEIGSVIQFPIIPAYAITCHKSQGLTLSAVVLHCSREYVPGLIYVGISRVKSPDHIQVLNFNASQLLKPGSDVITHSTSSSNDACSTMEDLSCCCHQILHIEQSCDVHDRLTLFEHEVNKIDDSYHFPANTSDEEVAKSFEDDTILTSCELAEVYERLKENKSNLAMPSEQNINALKEHLLDLKRAESQSSFVEQENNAIDFLGSQENVKLITSFISIIWYQCYKVICSYIKENGDKDGFTFNLQRQHFTEATASMHEFFTSPTFERYVCAIFSCLKPSAPQRTIAVKLSLEIYRTFLRHLASLMKERHECGEIDFSVKEMNVAGRSKVRYVGGWAIRKILTKYRKYVHQNMYSTNVSTIKYVHTKQKLCDLLDENVIMPFAKLQEESKFPDTLEVTEARQYRESGLLHISDEAYLFFMCLEDKRVQLLNRHRLKKEKENMVQNALETLLKDEDILVSWSSCFNTTDVSSNHVCRTYILHSKMLLYI